MANEKRLIDANELCEFFQERYEYLRSASERQLPNGYVEVDLEIQCGAIIAKEFLDKAKQAPTVDAVEVVWCKDCEYFTKGMAVGMCKRIADKPIMPITYNHFCSYGERRKTK